VQINPVARPGAPRSARDIVNRLNEISFNAALLKELRMMAVLQRVADPGDAEGAQWANMRIHRIASDKIAEYGTASKMNAEWSFLCLLRDEGRDAASQFLAEHGDALGQRSSFNLDELLEEI